MAKNKFYVVWSGREPGIYDSWENCKEQIESFPGAKYKGFPSHEAAESAFRAGPDQKDNAEFLKGFNALVKPDELSICVDAACSGNPGRMEYQGVWALNGDIIFREGPFEDANNNVGEFLAIVHGLSWMKKNNLNLPLYSDSITAMSWVRNKHAKTELKATPRNKKLFDLIHRAENWLSNNPEHAPVRKWDTKVLGEIPADFGRK